jgi:hemerythrin
MRAFLWDQRFETGIATVDQQHLGLVETVNELGNELMNGELRKRSSTNCSSGWRNTRSTTSRTKKS